MADNVGGGVSVGHFAALMLGLVFCGTAQPAMSANCPRPDALGTSRTLVVDAKQHPLIGSMQYRETLPLDDGEVVLTFDDGPIPKYTNQILDILAAQCVKATFFLVGRQAQANPEGVRKVLAGGHTIATHSQSHPIAMHRLPIDRAKAEIDDGIASVTAALGDKGAAMSPFFRIPGLARNDAIEEYTRQKGLQIWSADFPADDWRPVSSKRVYDLALQRLAAKGKGILLLHDIQPRTVAALPNILQDLKARGYRIVHVVSATADNPATPADPKQWRLDPAPELVAASTWPKIPTFVFAQHAPLPVPLLTDSYWNDIKIHDRSQPRGAGIPLPRQAPWPRLGQFAPIDAATVMPVPAASVFAVEEGVQAAMMGVKTVRPTGRRVAVATAERPGKRPANAIGSRARQVAARPARTVRTAAPPKRAAHDKKNVKPTIWHDQQASL
jgi:peptidoglycan/xylan/chitin deacetylase (PgdA/CDA1 family)